MKIKEGFYVVDIADSFVVVHVENFPGHCNIILEHESDSAQLRFFLCQCFKTLDETKWVLEDEDTSFYLGKF